ncbi:stage III sporulation protein AB [Pullulanibacillus pueri]|uniref:Stage III sporulation protein SpoAB n=1 Tax=Pullulanibacillus pueri TaxID=1437324 RepID=A0A8J2ZUZ5_9BACL|nr:stage III sporulation protein SpoIIIAB [Pullulanibacillus pueri]MBM7681585.1 stage III sporulation protein AB [Pullulanibacillus pueri]GGH79570.1 stage III sporulation protein SpoAB [Pullulanibacillus pueri]
MKIIGSLLIILASTAIGRLFAKGYRERPRQLRQLRSALQALETEITYSLTPISEAAARLAGQMPKPINQFFVLLQEQLKNKQRLSLQEAWNATMTQFWPYTALKKNEQEIMKQFGTTLGLSDRENQQKQIHLALTHLEREEIEAREAQATYEKLLNTMGFLAGILVVLVLF